MRIWTLVAALLLAAPALLADSFECKTTEVGVFENRIHIRCATAAPGGVSFFAASTTNSASAARLLSLMTAAHLAARPLTVTYDPADTTGSAFGCQAGDCRRIKALVVK